MKKSLTSIKRDTLAHLIQKAKREDSIISLFMKSRATILDVKIYHICQDAYYFIAHSEMTTIFTVFIEDIEFISEPVKK